MSNMNTRADLGFGFADLLPLGHGFMNDPRATAIGRSSPLRVAVPF